jgi:hypothetical protein
LISIFNLPLIPQVLKNPWLITMSRIRREEPGIGTWCPSKFRLIT